MIWILWARLELVRGRLDMAEQFAVVPVRRWEGIRNQRMRIMSVVLLATVQVRAGERDGLQLATTLHPERVTGAR
ncbi:MAG TPA: hypothetical protein VJT72_13095 [Pseudonocardiaceae bacterium]|nr:hypothetical protein [Pseudonocardiaceae bacterium]